jgi:hypothetical protein
MALNPEPLLSDAYDVPMVPIDLARLECRHNRAPTRLKDDYENDGLL